MPSWVVDGSTSSVGGTFDETKEEKGFGRNDEDLEVHEARAKEADSALAARGGVKGSAGDVVRLSGVAEEMRSSHMDRSCANCQLSF